MRLSSSSAEIATARTSRSLKSAKFFTTAPFPRFRMILNRYRGTVLGRQSFSSACLSQKRNQQPGHFRRSLLLHPMAGAVDEVTAEHAGASAFLHRLIDPGALIGAPVLLAGDEAGGHVDAAAGKRLELGAECARCPAAIPLQAALEAYALIFRTVERQFAI